MSAELSSSKPRHAWIGPLEIALAGILWSTSGFFAKSPWFEGWPVDTRGLLLAFWRSLFAMVLLIPLVRKPVWRWQMLPMVLSFAVMIWSFMTAMVSGSAANAIWLQYLAPVWVILMGWLFLKELPTREDWIMFAFCAGGVGLIVCMEMQYGSLYATCLGILSGITYAGVILCLRSMRGADSVWLITLNHGASALLLLPWVLQNTHQVPTTSYLALAMFGFFQMSLAYILFARGLRTTGAAEASLLSLIEPVLLPVWVYIAWHHHPLYEAPPLWTWLGGGLILIGLVSRYLPSILRRPSPGRIAE